MAEDIWESLLFEASFGGIRIDVQSTSDANGRVLATHQSPHRDGAAVEDMGGEARVTRCRVIFFQVSDDDDPHDRFAFFLAAKNRGATLTFVHPISGSYKAKIGQFDWSANADERGVIAVDCSFHEDADEPEIFGLGAGAPNLSGVDEVDAAAASLSAAIDEVNAALGLELETDVGEQSLALAEELAAGGDDLTARDVNLKLVALSNEIQAATDELEVATDIDRYPIMVALSNLHYAVRRAADAVIEKTPRIIEIRVAAPTPLYTIAARTYGADEAEERFEQLIRLNSIRDPSVIPGGTVLKAESRDTEFGVRNPAERAFR